MEPEKKSKFVIDTCFNHVNKLIFLDELSSDVYFEKCKKEFGFQCESTVYRVTTETGAPIAPNRFVNVIELSGGYTKVHLWVRTKESDATIVTPNDIKQYLISRNADYILSENESGLLTEKSRRQLIRHISEYQTSRFGENPTREQRQAVATATGFVFETLSASIIRGFCNIRACNERAATKRTQMASKSATEPRTDEECRLDVELLKTLVLNPENMDTIKKKLVATMDFRLKMVDKVELDLLETFPYFFAYPELVQFDFAHRFPKAETVRFLDLWPTIREDLNIILKDQYKASIHTVWPKEIQDLLILLKLAHANSGRNLLTPLAFNKAVDKLIIFRENDVPLEQMLEPKNSHPYIIACGESRDKITHFYIDLEKHLMSVPENYGIAQTFDLFLKTHSTLGLHFEENIKTMAHYCLHFIYGVKKLTRPTPRLKNLFESLLR